MLWFVGNIVAGKQVRLHLGGMARQRYCLTKLSAKKVSLTCTVCDEKAVFFVWQDTLRTGMGTFPTSPGFEKTSPGFEKTSPGLVRINPGLLPFGSSLERKQPLSFIWKYHEFQPEATTLNDWTIFQTAKTRIYPIFCQIWLSGHSAAKVLSWTLWLDTMCGTYF